MVTNREALDRIAECKKNKRERLDLSNLALAKIPEEIAELEWLNELDLSANLISKIEGLQSLTSLMILNLYNNQIRKIQGVETLTSLTELYLYDNQISKIEDLHATELIKQLEKIDLSGNPIENIPEAFLIDVSALLGYFESRKNTN